MVIDPADIKSPITERRIPWQVAVGIGVLVLAALVNIPLVNHILGPYWSLFIYDACVIASALAAAILSTRLWRVYERGETLSLVWGSMAVGLILWATGEIIWSYDQIWGGMSLPYPSLADFLWIIGYVPIIWALVNRYRTFRVKLSRWWQFAVLAIYVVVLFTVIIFILYPIFFTDLEAVSVFEKIVNLIYPIGDLIVAFLATMLVMVLIGGVLFSSWGLIAVGFLFAAISDLIYAWTVWQGTYHVIPTLGIDISSFITNLLYVAFYVLVAIGLFKQASMVKAV